MIHDKYVSLLWPETSGSLKDGYRDKGLLGSATARPFQSAFGDEIHPSVMEKGAALFHSLIANHPFEDGNKRTAVIALQLFLAANNVFLFPDHRTIYDLAVATASSGQHGVDPERALAQILAKLKLLTVPFAKIKQISVTNQLAAEMYEMAQQMKRGARNHKLNQL